MSLPLGNLSERVLHRMKWVSCLLCPVSNRRPSEWTANYLCISGKKQVTSYHVHTPEHHISFPNVVLIIFPYEPFILTTLASFTSYKTEPFTISRIYINQTNSNTVSSFLWVFDCSIYGTLISAKTKDFSVWAANWTFTPGCPPQGRASPAVAHQQTSCRMAGDR